MNEHLKILAALARSLGASSLSLGISEDITAAIVAAGGTSKVHSFPESDYVPGAYTIESVEIVIDGVRIECQSGARICCEVAA